MRTVKTFLKSLIFAVPAVLLLLYISDPASGLRAPEAEELSTFQIIAVVAAATVGFNLTAWFKRRYYAKKRAYTLPQNSVAEQMSDLLK